MKILLVDDDLVNQKITLKLLSKWRYEITVAPDASSVINALQSRDFDVVLLDLNLSDVSGFDIASSIRALDDPYFRQLPILAFVMPADETHEKAKASGVTDFVAKPLNAAELHAAIDRWSLGPKVDNRPLRIRFEAYGEDEVSFKSGLIQHMIQNLCELRLAAYKAYYAMDPRVLEQAAHKIKSTLLILDDRQFNYALDGVREGFAAIATRPGEVQSLITALSKFIQSIINTLGNELELLVSTQPSMR